MEVEIKEMPELRVGAVRHVGPYNQIPQAFERLGSIVGPTGLAGRPETAMVAIYYDDPDSTPPPELRSDAGITVPDGCRCRRGSPSAASPPDDTRERCTSARTSSSGTPGRGSWASGCPRAGSESAKAPATRFIETLRRPFRRSNSSRISTCRSRSGSLIRSCGPCAWLRKPRRSLRDTHDDHEEVF